MKEKSASTSNEMDVIWAFRRTVARDPDRVFAIDRDGQVTYREAEQRSESIANSLIEIGFAPGEIVGLCSHDSVAQLLWILGVWKAGLLPGLIDPRTPDEELPYFIEDMRAKSVLAHPTLHERLKAAGARDVCDIESSQSDSRATVDRHSPAAPLYLSYTSGTTGRPKGVVLRSGPVTIGTACIAERLALTRDDVIVVTTPTSSSFQLVSTLMPALHVGATVGLAAGMITDEIWDAGVEWQASTLVGYPLTLADIVNHAQAGRHDIFRMALSGGSPLAPRIKHDYRQQLGIPLLESYGQSELGGFMALSSPNDDDGTSGGYVGRPLPDRPAYPADEDGRELPVRVVGEVVVPFGYFDRYLNKPDETGKTLAGNVLHCGDLALRDERGRLKVLGRTSEAATAEQRGGFLRELEDAFYDHPDVLHAAVVECTFGHVEVFVELLPGRHESGSNIAAWAGAKVPAGLRPTTTAILERMPRTFSGKANRRLLSQQCRSQSSTRTDRSDVS